MTNNPTSIPLGQLESSPSAKFTNFGDSYKGRIVGLVERQQTDIEGRPLTFNDGSPRMQWVIQIEQVNGDTVALYAKGGKFKAVQGQGASMLSAIGQAVKAAGATAVDVGAELAVVYTGLSDAQPGKSAAKLYTAQYRSAQAQPSSVPVDLFES
jgi:hypothetical protein